MLNVKRLKHFVAVAEELHFGRAAERLGIAQPPLSQSIRRLEASLGCELFTRTRRSVELTTPGRELLKYARQIVDQVDYCVRTVQSAGEVGAPAIRIGYTPNAMWSYLPAAVQVIKASFPVVKVTLVDGTTTDHVKALATGELDIGFLNAPEEALPNFEIHNLAHPRLIAAVPADWPLARIENPQLADLKDVPLILFPRKTAPEAHDEIMATLRRAGVQPSIFLEATFDHARLRLSEAGLGVSLISELNASLFRSSVVQRRIAGLPATIGPAPIMAWHHAVPAKLRRVYLAAAAATVNEQACDAATRT